MKSSQPPPPTNESKVPSLSLPASRSPIPGVITSGNSTKPLSVASPANASSNSNNNVKFVIATPRTPRAPTANGSGNAAVNPTAFGSRSATTTNTTTTTTTTALSPAVIAGTPTNPTATATTTLSPVAITSTSTNTLTSTATATATTSTAGASNSSMGAGVSQSSSADKAKRLQAREDLKNFGVLRERALQRDAFMNAMSTRKVAEIDKACARFPKDAELASYLPIIIREKLGGIELKFYVEGGGKDPRVTAYVDWCLRYGNELPELHSYLVGDRSQPEPVAPELYDLCLDLRLLKDTDSDASLKKSALIIKKKIAANEDTSALALARQPYASTRMMLQKCVLLAPYIDGQKFAGFFINLQQAHEIRKTSTTALRLALVNKALSARDLREHALNVYARRMTIPTGSFIPSDAKPALLKAMHDTLLVLSVESDIHWMEDEALSQLKALIKQKMDQLG